MAPATVHVTKNELSTHFSHAKRTIFRSNTKAVKSVEAAEATAQKVRVVLLGCAGLKLSVHHSQHLECICMRLSNAATKRVCSMQPKLVLTRPAPAAAAASARRLLLSLPPSLPSLPTHPADPGPLRRPPGRADRQAAPAV
jgi:hypothetical protein